MKNILLNQQEELALVLAGLPHFLSDYKNLVFQIGKNEEGKKEIALVHKVEEGEAVVLHKTEYLTDFSETCHNISSEFHFLFALKSLACLHIFPSLFQALAATLP